MKHYIPSTLALAVVLSISGCGGTEVELVTGRVLLDGKPLTEVSVCLWPQKDLNQGILMAYEVDIEGRFEMRARPERGEDRAGDYVGLIYESKPFLKRFDTLEYSQPETSPFLVTVNKGVTHLEDFHLVDEGKFAKKIDKLVEEAHEKSRERYRTFPGR